MKVGTIWRTRDCPMRHGGIFSLTRAPRPRTLPTDHSHAARQRDAGATRGYQRDSSSKRPAFSAALVQEKTKRPPAPSADGHKENT